MICDRDRDRRTDRPDTQAGRGDRGPARRGGSDGTRSAPPSAGNARGASALAGVAAERHLELAAASSRPPPPPLLAVVAAIAALAVLAGAARLIARRPQALAPLAVLALPFRVPIHAG